MILVIVGLMYGFERLVIEMDEIAGNICEEVVMQIGDTSYKPKNSKYFRFIPKEDLDRLCINSRVVVCHGGVGSILTALSHNKPIIVVPRNKKYKEVVDNHQFEISKELEKEGKISVVYDILDLKGEIMSISNSYCKIETNNKLVIALKEYIDKLSM